MSTGQHAHGVAHPNQQRLAVALEAVVVVVVVDHMVVTGVGMVAAVVAVVVVAPQGLKRPGLVTGHALTATTSVLPLGNALRHSCITTHLHTCVCC